MTAAIVLASLVTLIFVLLGTAKILALAPMPELAAKFGFSTMAYRRIGVLEVAGAIGVALGPVVHLLGGMAGAGLLTLLAGALVTHVRTGDKVVALIPAAVCVVLVAGYLAVLFGATA